jgi:AcrR family transcriptional regulator
LREETILASTHDLMATRGLHVMTMDDVADAVGISKTTLYQHFKSKEELAAAVINGKFRELLIDIQALAPSLSSLLKLRQTLTCIIAKRFGENSMCMFASEATMNVYLQNQPEYMRNEQMLIDALSSLIDTAKSEGHIASHLSTLVMVQMLLSCVRDASYEQLLRTGRCTIEEMTGTLIAMICCKSS